MARTAKKGTALTVEEKLAQALVPAAEQPYQVPENWCWIRLDALKVDANGFFDGDWILSENMDSSGEVRLLQLSDIGIGEFLDKSDKHISESTYTQLGCTPLHEGDVMISRMAEPIARSCIVPSFPYTVITAVDVAVIRCNPSIVFNCYLNYLCNAKWFTDLAFSLARGTTRVRITRKNLGDMPVPLPPLAEQQRIVDRIESLFAKLDEAKEKAQAVVDGFEDRKAAILHKAFTGELTAEWRMEHKQSKAEWEHKKFSEICDIVRGGSPRPAGDPKYYDGDIPFMKVADITNNSGPYVTSATYSIKEAGLKKTRMIEPNTLLLTNSGATLGVPAICTFQTTFNDGIAAFLNLNPESLLFFYYFWSSKTPELRSINMGAAQPNLNTSIIGAVEIDIPAIEEQKEIVRILETVLEKEEQVKESAEQVIDQIDAMKKSILARAFRGELGTNDPVDESAEELLKRVL